MVADREGFARVTKVPKLAHKTLGPYSSILDEVIVSYFSTKWAACVKDILSKTNGVFY